MLSVAKVRFENIVDVYAYDSLEEAKQNKNSEQLLHTHNDIHPENMSFLLGSAIMHYEDNQLAELVLGNGGAQVDNIGEAKIIRPNTTGRNITLYNQTYNKPIGNDDPANLDPENNNITIEHVTGNSYTDVIVRATLNRYEPDGQDSIDTTESLDETKKLYVFSEIGLQDKLGNLVCHTTFNPIEKTANRVIVIVYRVRIIVV